MAISPPTRNITPMPMAPSPPLRAQRVAPQLGFRPDMGTPLRPKPRAGICTPPTMATFTRTPATVGALTTTATGTRSIVRRTLRHKSRTIKTPAPTKPRPSSAHRVRSARLSPRKVGAQVSMKWTAKPRTASGADFRAKASIISGVVAAALVAADSAGRFGGGGSAEEASVAGAGLVAEVSVVGAGLVAGVADKWMVPGRPMTGARGERWSPITWPPHRRRWGDGGMLESSPAPGAAADRQKPARREAEDVR